VIIGVRVDHPHTPTHGFDNLNPLLQVIRPVNNGLVPDSAAILDCLAVAKPANESEISGHRIPCLEPLLGARQGIHAWSTGAKATPGFLSTEYNFSESQFLFLTSTTHW
jgi:hypothetical protein